MIQISREAAQVLRNYVGSTLPYGNVHVQAAVNELEAALDKPVTVCCSTYEQYREKHGA